MTADDPLRSLWQTQPTAAIDPAALEKVKSMSDQMNKRTNRRNWSETVAGVIVVAVFLSYAAAEKELLLRVAWLLTAAGGALVLVTLWRRGRMRPPPAPSEPSAAYLAYYRGELARERDLLASAWLWYVGPIVPGLSLAFFAMARTLPIGWTASTYAICLVVFAFVAWINKRGARKLSREFDALSSSGSLG